MACEFAVFAYVGGRSAADPFGCEKHSEPPVVDTAIVRDDSEIGRALLKQRHDQVLGYAVKAEASDSKRGTIRNIGNGLRCRRYQLIHRTRSVGTA